MKKTDIRAVLGSLGRGRENTPLDAAEKRSPGPV